MSNTRMSVALVALVGLSACGGGSSGLSFDDLQQDFNDQADNLGLGSDLNTTALMLSAPSAIPTSGGAEYSGQLIMILSDTGIANDIVLDAASIASEAIVGEIDMTATFASSGGTITGSATNFFNNDGSAISGSVNIGAVSIDRYSASVLINVPAVGSPVGTLSGSLTGTTGSTGTVNLNGGVIGGFADPDASVWGVVSGDSNPATDNVAFKGIFIGAEDSGN